MELLIFLVWVVGFGLLCAYIAGEKGRSSLNWGVLGALFGVFALIAIVAVPALASRNTDASDDYVAPGLRVDNAQALTRGQRHR